MLTYWGLALVEAVEVRLEVHGVPNPDVFRQADLLAQEISYLEDTAVSG